jgi:hypothetical protein
MLKVKTNSDLGEEHALRSEIYEYTKVLKGEEPSPLDGGILDLMEVAAAYYIRAKEITMYLHEKEREEGDKSLYKFRTSELRDFTDLAKAAMDLGSRRLTAHREEVEEMFRG